MEMTDDIKELNKNNIIVWKLCSVGEKDGKIKIISTFDEKKENHLKRFKQAQELIKHESETKDNYIIKAALQDFNCFNRFWIDELINIEIPKTKNIIKSSEVNSVELKKIFDNAVNEAEL